MPYTVQRGDTLGEIAAANGTTVEELVRLNPQYASNPNLIHPGETVALPGDETTTDSGDTTTEPETPETENTDFGEPGWWTAAQRFEETFGYAPSQWSTAEQINMEVQRALEDPVRWIPGYDPRNEPGWWTAAQRFEQIFGKPPSPTATKEKIMFEVDRAIANPERWDPRFADSPTTPTPDPATDPEAEPVDFRSRVRALYPFLPEQLTDVFAEAWAESGNAQLALAEMRASDIYDQFYPGNRRDDGTLRHTEAEYASIKDAYRQLYQDFGLNPSLFEDRFTELIVNDQSPAEHARKLGAAFEGVVNNIPQVREIYAQYGNIQMTDQAIFASVIDPTIGEAIINRRISVAQVGGEGLARGFDVDEDFAGRLVSGGVDQMTARTLFSDAEGRLSTLDTLVRRHRDPDDDFDLEEFADANVFGDAAQNRRIQRALRAEASMFTEQAGSISTSQGLQVTGLSAQ